MASKAKKPALKNQSDKKVLKKRELKKTVAVKKRIEKISDRVSAMDKLMTGGIDQVKAFKRSEEVSGVVTFLGRALMLIDIGAKTEGMVMDKEMKEARDLLEGIKVGDKIKAYVKYPENDQGQAILSLRRALEESRWEGFDALMDVEKEVEVKGLEVNKGGMIVDVDGVRGFVPTSQFGARYLGKMSQLLNKSFKVKVIEVDRDQNRLIFSEKLVSDAEGLAKKGEALNMVEEGERFKGTVSGIMPFGVFVTVIVPVRSDDGKNTKEEARVEGLVHISELSWEKVDDPNEVFKVGQELDVQVIGIDKAANKLNLSVKRLANDPWQEIDKRYAIGTKHSGEVIRVAPYGVLVNFEKGVDGLIHVSKMPNGKEFKMGEKIDAYVETLDMRTRRMSLGVVLTEVPVGYR